MWAPTRLTGVRPKLCSTLHVWPWEGHMASLSLGVSMLPRRVVVGFRELLEQCQVCSVSCDSRST